jgi:uncharacterized protein
MAGKSRRGFASMDPAKQREIASKGGRAAHAKGTAHEWSSEEARNAGRKGGEVVSRDRAHMAAIGREGGEARGRKARERKIHGSQGSMTTAPSTATQSGALSYREREAGISVSREVPGIAASDAQSVGGGSAERSRENGRSDNAQGSSDQGAGR